MFKQNVDPSLIIKPTSTALKFNLSNEAILNNLQALNTTNPAKFSQINKIGHLIQKAVKNDDIDSLKKQLDNHIMIIPLLKLFIDEAFLDALYLRYHQIIKYMLDNGYDLDQECENSVLTVCNTLEYLNNDPPLDLLELVLSYGANPNSCDETTSMTGYHITAQYGSIEFAKLLEKYGGDHDAVDNCKKTPLNYAKQRNQKQMEEYLLSLGAKDSWKY